VDPSDVEALAEGIMRLWKDPALRTSLGAAGRERVVSELTWEHFGAGVRGAMRAVVEKGADHR
jgi:glycosyltransferase involved in cell wall biosynthesis